uniref:CUB domain-containing protein n=1 Tax=Meloidogyne floridensis TaxID=298350 RepID=A0A915P591_9BILA
MLYYNLIFVYYILLQLQPLINSYGDMDCLSGDKNVNVPVEFHNFSSSINGGLFFKFVTDSACDCFPNNLTLCRIHPLNLLSPGFPEYCDNLNCSTNIYLESPFITNDYAECLQIQFNSFLNEVDKDLLHLKIPLGDEETKLISFGGGAQKINFFTFDSPKFILNLTTNAVGVDSKFNLTIKYIKRDKECLCHDNLNYLKIFNGKKNSVQKKLGSREVGSENKIEFNVSKVSTFLFKRDASINIWYHREFEEIINNNTNIPRQINFTYDWRERCKCGEVHLKATIDNWNVLYSPDYPETYCHSMDCLWRLEAQKGYH